MLSPSPVLRVREAEGGDGGPPGSPALRPRALGFVGTRADGPWAGSRPAHGVSRADTDISKPFLSPPDPIPVRGVLLGPGHITCFVRSALGRLGGTLAFQPLSQLHLEESAPPWIRFGSGRSQRPPTGRRRWQATRPPAPGTAPPGR